MKIWKKINIHSWWVDFPRGYAVDKLRETGNFQKRTIFKMQTKRFFLSWKTTNVEFDIIKRIEKTYLGVPTK